MYFDAAVVFVAKSSLLFRLAVAILCWNSECLTRNRTILTSFSPSWAAAVEDDVKEEAVEESADGQRPVSERSCHHVRAGTTLKTELL